MTSPEPRACTGFDAASGRPCTLTPKKTVKAACVHEHVGEHRLCLSHCNNLAEGIMLCGACLQGGHECSLVPLNKADAYVPRRDWTRELLQQCGAVDDELLDILAGEEPRHG